LVLLILRFSYFAGEVARTQGLDPCLAVF